MNHFWLWFAIYNQSRVTIRLHQGSALNAFLFIVVLDVLSQRVRRTLSGPPDIPGNLPQRRCRYIYRYDVPPRGPLFVLPGGSPVTRSFFTDNLHRSLIWSGLSPKTCKGHSFRIGAATMALMMIWGDGGLELLRNTYAYQWCCSL